MRRSRPALVRALLALGRFTRRKPLGALGGIIVIAMLVMAAFAEQIAPYRYDETIRGARMKAPGAAHWLGTDNLSRDMWSRIVYGARVSITIGFLTIGLAMVLATAIGVTSAYFGGAWDLVVQRVVDAWLSFPVSDHHPVGDGRPGAGARQRRHRARRAHRRHQLARHPGLGARRHPAQLHRGGARDGLRPRADHPAAHHPQRDRDHHHPGHDRARRA